MSFHVNVYYNGGARQTNTPAVGKLPVGYGLYNLICADVLHRVLTDQECEKATVRLIENGEKVLKSITIERNS